MIHNNFHFNLFTARDLLNIFKIKFVPRSLSSRSMGQLLNVYRYRVQCQQRIRIRPAQMNCGSALREPSTKNTAIDQQQLWQQQ